MVALLVATALGCGRVPQIPAEGELAGQPIATTVDSPLAKYYLENYLPGKRTDPESDAAIEEALSATERFPLDRYELRRLSERVSTDFATLHFVRRLYTDPANRRLQDHYNDWYRQFTNAEPGLAPPAPRAYRDYFLAFVPGYAYRMEPATGADFAAQRQLMQRYGFQTALIEIDELGSVEKNAAIIADSLEELARRHDRMILISTSKGGPEAAAALAELLSPEAREHVRAWISIGGLLRGSPIADRWNRWPRSWVARLALPRAGYDPDIVHHLNTEVRRAAMDRLGFPPGLWTLQYVGVPLSGDVGPSARNRYRAMRTLGPNDGLTLLVDELLPRGNVIFEAGLDHFYRHPNIDLKALALTYTVLAELEPEELTPAPAAKTGAEGGAGETSRTKR